MASGDSVQQIKDRLSIIDVISPYVELHQAGKNFKGKSPFTTEKTPSFYVSPDRGMYYCFSSSQGGDIFTFVEKMEGVDFKGALKILADKAGVELVPEDPKKRTERDTQYSILEEATKYFEGELTKNGEAMKYVTDRGISKETIGAWRLGYVPGPPKNGWRHTREVLKQKNFKDEELLKAGLVKDPGEGKEPYDVFRDRVMFPIADPSGRIIAFSGRVLEKDTEAPKYVNSPETELFNKSEALFGYDKAKQGIRQLDFSLIVEGQFDVVLAHQAGYHNTVAVSGTALTPHHVSLLQRLSNRVVLALDSDRAGIAAVKRAADLMLSRGMDLKVAKLPDGKDPADIIGDDAEAFKKIVGHATHVIEFLLTVLEAETNDERAYKLRARDEILPFLLKMDSQIDKEHFMGVVAERLDTTKDAISLEVARLEASAAHTSSRESESVEVEQSEGGAPTELRKDRLLAYLVVAADVLAGDRQTKLRTAIGELTGKSIEALREELPKETLSQLVFTLEEQFSETQDKELKTELIDSLRELESILNRETLKEHKETLVASEVATEEEQIKEAIAAISKLQQKMGNSSIPETFFD